MACALRPLGVGVGHPRPPRCSGPSVPWVSLRDPLGCPPMPKQDGIGSRAPTLCGCAGGGSGPMMWTSCIHSFSKHVFTTFLFVEIDTSFQD